MSKTSPEWLVSNSTSTKLCEKVLHFPLSPEICLIQVQNNVTKEKSSALNVVETEKSQVCGSESEKIGVNESEKGYSNLASFPSFSSTSSGSLIVESDDSTSDLTEEDEDKRRDSLISYITPKNCWNWLCFFALGYVNNVTYHTSIVSAQSLSVFYSQERWFGFVVWANIFLGIFSQIGFTFFLRRCNHNIVFLCSGLILIASVLGVIMGILIFGKDSQLGFWFTIVCILVVGGVNTIGLSLIYRYLTIFDSCEAESRFIVSGICSGTGMSGVGGAGFYLLFKICFGFKDVHQFSLLIPMIIVYMIIPFFCIIKPHKEQQQLQKGNREHNKNFKESNTSSEEDSESSAIIPQSDTSTSSSLFSSNTVSSDFEENGRHDDETRKDGNEEKTEPLEQVETEYYCEPKELSNWDLYTDAFQKCWYVFICTFSVYFAGYLIQTGLSEKMVDYEKSQLSDYLVIRNSYVIFSLIFRLGIFFTRTFSMLVRFKKGWILVVIVFLQLCNLIVWFFFAKTKVLSTYSLIWIPFAFIFVIGLLSGVGNVNAFFVIMNLVKFRFLKSREISLYVNLLMENLGVAGCAIVTLILHNTVLQS